MIEPPPSDETPEEVLDHLDDGTAGDRVIRGGAMRTVAYVAGILAGLISTPLMVRHLGDVEFGQFVTVNSLIFVIAGLTEGGLTAIAVREYSAAPAERERMMENLLGLRAVLLALGTIGAVGFAILAGYSSVLVAGTVIACGALLGNTVYGICTVPLVAGLRQGVMAAMDFLRQVVLAGLVVALVVVGATLLSFFAATVVVALAAAGVVVWITRREVPWRPRFDLGDWKRLLWASIPYGLATAFTILYFRVAILVMSIVSTGQETGFYSLAFRVVELVTGVPYLLIFVAFPILARAAGASDDERLSYALQRMVEVALILGAAAAICLGLGAPFAVKVLGGAGFEPAVTPLVVLGTAVIGTFLVATWSYALLSLERFKVLVIANGSAVVVGTVLTLILAGRYGALGSAIATAATEIGLGVAYGVIISIVRPDLRPQLGIVPKIIVAALVAIAVPLLIGVPSVVASALGGVLFLGVLQLLGAIPREVLQAMRNVRA